MSSTDFARADLVPPALAAPSADVAPASYVGDAPAAPVVPVERWNLVTRIAFRFTAVYLVLYGVLATGQIFGGMIRPIVFDLFGPVTRYFGWNISGWFNPHYWPSVQNLGNHIATKWWGFAEPSRGWHQGGGDKPFDWALAYGLLLIAAAIAAVWSAVDWKRVSYPRLHGWLRLFLRVAVGTQMISYGFAKAFPMQMPFPPLTGMLGSYGDLGLMRILWFQVGSSPAYEIFTGCAEVAAGILLLFPGLTTVGALFGIAVTSQIWILNMTFDVPVKNLSMHLLIMCIVLLIPEAWRLAQILVLRRPIGLAPEPRLFKNVTRQRVAIALQVVFAAYVVIWGGSGYLSAKANWANNPANQPKPPLYGIWTVDKMMINGVERAPLLSDYDRFHRIIFERPHSVTFQRTNSQYMPLPARVDLPNNTIKFTTDVPNPFLRPGTPKPPVQEFGQMTIQQPTPDKLILEGIIHGRPTRLEATHWDHTKNFRLMQAKFRWIQ